METIIIQDANEAVLDVLTIALQMEGFRVVSVLNYDDGLLNIINKIRPQAVILDYKLDGHRCVQICKCIKAKHAYLPVIALSCNNNINEEYKKYGFDDYIKKPFDLDMLYKTLRKHILKHK